MLEFKLKEHQHNKKLNFHTYEFLYKILYKTVHNWIIFYRSYNNYQGCYIVYDFFGTYLFFVEKMVPLINLLKVVSFVQNTKIHKMLFKLASIESDFYVNEDWNRNWIFN